MIRSFALVLALGSLALGCKKAEEAKAAPAAAKVEPAPAQPAQAAPDMKALCVQSFQKSRACTADFIPALVDARAKYDVPKGIADEVKKDRNAVIAQAMKEWETDSTDEAITANCEKMPPPADAATAQACLAKTDCKEFVACMTPFLEKQFSK